MCVAERPRPEYLADRPAHGGAQCLADRLVHGGGHDYPIALRMAAISAR